LRASWSPERPANCRAAVAPRLGGPPARLRRPCGGSRSDRRRWWSQSEVTVKVTVAPPRRRPGRAALIRFSTLMFCQAHDSTKLIHECRQSGQVGEATLCSNMRKHQQAAGGAPELGRPAPRRAASRAALRRAGGRAAGACGGQAAGPTGSAGGRRARGSKSYCAVSMLDPPTCCNMLLYTRRVDPGLGRLGTRPLKSGFGGGGICPGNMKLRVGDRR
jgi:hypothetical protein